ncbi:MAG: hypothetical protein EU539_13555 [Promethearchaeota archaeon]|nr:MAG: hypothetical protein EU539_13555 [Candidatus Lokiarchaeota archaeon]
MSVKKNIEKENLTLLIKKAIELLCEKNISDVVILSSYKINSVLRENYGVDIKVDRIGRILSSIAKRNELKRLSTSIPKYRIKTSQISHLKFF